MLAFDERLRSAFPGCIVSKKISVSNAVLSRLPRFVSEYILAQNIVNADNEEAGIQEAEQFVQTYCPRSEDRTWLKHQLTTIGRLKILDQLIVQVDLSSGTHWANLLCLGEDRLRISPDLADKNLGAMYGGLWGLIEIRYEPKSPDSEFKGKMYPGKVINFTPMQIDIQDISVFQEKRGMFSSDEWIDLIVKSIGINPESLGSGTTDLRRKLLLLARLVPLVEPNVNLIELGPKNTGKTYTLRNLSPHCFVISGGRSTPANLFVNLRTGAIGIIGIKKAVVFDEIGKVEFGDQDATTSILKDYLESGQFSRGRSSYTADASILFVGNIEIDSDRPSEEYKHLFQPLPDMLQDTALFDRLHGFLPGWELPKLGTNSLSTEIGLLSDYFSEILNQLRNVSFENVYQRLLGGRTYLPGMTRRDENAMNRIARGLLKLVFPDGNVQDKALGDNILSLAAELRQRIHNQLVIMDPGEFQERAIGLDGLRSPWLPLDFQRLEVQGVSNRDLKLNSQAIVGEITGLTVMTNKKGDIIGGDVQIIEVSVLERGHGGFRLVGMHGPAMKHSIQAAYNFVRDNVRNLGLPVDAMNSKHLVIHLLSVAQPREGPSAGLAFVIGMVSALSGLAVLPALSVTGEVSLHGRVTSVGGIPQKLVAARNHGRRIVIVPQENEKDISRMDANVITGLRIIYVNTVTEALNSALIPVYR